MLISPRGKARSSSTTAGFTLIELLVVVAIMAILALGLGFGSGGVYSRISDTPRAIADRLSDAVALARDTAILGRDTVGLRPQGAGWSLVRRDPQGVWRVIAPPEDGTTATLSWRVAGGLYVPRSAADDDIATPAVLFLPDGRGTALSAAIGGLDERVMCVTNGREALSCQ